MLRFFLMLLMLFSACAMAASGKVAKLVNLNFEYVKLVYAVAQDCANTATQYAKSSQDKQLTIETMRCYSFLLEKREKLEREVFVPLRRAGFPSANLTDKDKEFIKMVYVIDDSIDDIGHAVEPILKRKMGKKAAKKPTGKSKG